MPFNDNEPLFCHVRTLMGYGIFQNISEIAKSSSTGKQLEILPVTMTCPKKDRTEKISERKVERSRFSTN